jgi:hypothetical protein
MDKRVAAVAASGRPGKPGGAPVRAGNAFENPLSGDGLPSYDAVENDRHTRKARSGPKSAMNLSGAAEKPLAGGGKAGRTP